MIEFAAEGSVSAALAEEAQVKEIQSELFEISQKFGQAKNPVTGMVLKQADFAFLIDRLGLSYDHAARISVLIDGLLRKHRPQMASTPTGASRCLEHSHPAAAALAPALNEQEHPLSAPLPIQTLIKSLDSLGVY